LISQLAIRTNGNLPRVDGLQDSDANRALWGELGPRALEHARKAHALRPDSVAAAAALANAYMFYASSLGIVRSILQGAGGEYREHATRLVALDAAHDDGLGDTLLAGFYLVAPWPVGDREAARAHYERALALSPGSVRNHYGLGVYWAREGDSARARPYFQRSISLPCSHGSERLFCDWIKQESRRVLAGF
jgi:tetratricopeptide (TPR) repeat protein